MMPKAKKKQKHENIIRSDAFYTDYRALPSSVDENERTIDVEYTTGASVLRYDWYTGEYYYEELSLKPGAVRLGLLNNGAPVLDNHNRYSVDNVLGTILSADESTAKLRFASDERSDVVFQKIKDGILSKVSVGYRIHAIEKTGERDGRAILTATDWEPFEISVVAIPADDAAGFRSEKSSDAPSENIISRTLSSLKPTPADENQALLNSTRQGDNTMPPEVEIQDNPLTTTPQQRTADTPDVAAQVTAQIAAERARCQSIAQIARDHDLGNEFADDMIARGLTLDEVRKEALQSLSTRSQTTAINTHIRVGTDHSRQNLMEGIENSLLYRCAPMQFNLSECGRQYTGLSLMDIAREFVQDRHVRRTHDIATRALHTTSDLPLVLQNVMNKIVTVQFAEAKERTYTSFARKRTANDFKDLYGIQVDGDFKLEKVNEHGEYKSTTLAESAEKFRIAKYGKKIGFSLEMLINDDMNVFEEMVPAFIAGAIETELDIVYGLLKNNPVMSDGKALFHADHNNIITDVLSTGGLDAMSQKMKKQKSLSGKKLSVPMDFIIYGDELDPVVDRILTAEYNPTNIDDVNPYGPRGRKKMIAIYEPSISDISPTVWFAGTNSTKAKHISYASLNGYEVPTIKRIEGNDPDGLTLVARHFFGAGVEGYTGIYRSTGA